MFVASALGASASVGHAVSRLKRRNPCTLQVSLTADGGGEWLLLECALSIYYVFVLLNYV